MNLLGKLTPYKKNVVLLKEYQKTNDIIGSILTAHNKYKNDYDKIANQFWRGNVYDSCRNIFNFLKKNVKYRIEPDTRQSVKSPSAIISTGRFGGYNDCKHYSSFFAGIIDSWNRSGKKINWCYRFANYKLFKNDPHHVFVVIDPGTDREIWCDAVLNSFDQKKPFINKIDKKPMALYSISGIPEHHRRKYKYSENSFSGFEIGKVRKTKTGKFLQKISRGGKKIALAPSRKAFLILVRLNAFKIALHLYNTLLNPDKKQKLFETWRKLGGNPSVLSKSIQKAFEKYKRKHGQTVGEAVTLTTILTASAPILVALAKFLPEGSKARQIAETTGEAVQTYTSATQSQNNETE